MLLTSAVLVNQLLHVSVVFVVCLVECSPRRYMSGRLQQPTVCPCCNREDDTITLDLKNRILPQKLWGVVTCLVIWHLTEGQHNPQGPRS